MGGREDCPLVADWNCPVADTNLPMRGGRHRPLLSAQRFDSFPVEGLGQSHGVSAGCGRGVRGGVAGPRWRWPTFWAWYRRA